MWTRTGPTKESPVSIPYLSLSLSLSPPTFPDSDMPISPAVLAPQVVIGYEDYVERALELTNQKMAAMTDDHLNRNFEPEVIEEVCAVPSFPRMGSSLESRLKSRDGPWNIMW
jgi:hypothetical protein